MVFDLYVCLLEEVSYDGVQSEMIFCVNFLHKSNLKRAQTVIGRERTKVIRVRDEQIKSRTKRKRERESQSMIQKEFAIKSS
jgi:hypothetical protein